MKVGDSVRSIRTNNRVGTILRTYHNHYGLVLVVRWANGSIYEYTCDDLQKVEAK